MLSNEIAKKPVEITPATKFARRGKNTKKKLHDTQELDTSRLFSLIDSCEKKDKYYDAKLTEAQKNDLNVALKRAEASENADIHTDYNVSVKKRTRHHLKFSPLTKIGFFLIFTKTF